MLAVRTAVSVSVAAAITLSVGQFPALGAPLTYTVSVQTPSHSRLMADIGVEDNDGSVMGCRSNVVAWVKGPGGYPVSGVKVSFSIVPATSGVSLSNIYGSSSNEAYTDGTGSAQIWVSSNSPCAVAVKASVRQPDGVEKTASSLTITFCSGDWAISWNRASVPTPQGEWRVQQPPGLYPCVGVTGFGEGSIGFGPGTQPDPWVSGPLVYDNDCSSLRFGAWSDVPGDSSFLARADIVDANIVVDYSIVWSSQTGSPEPAGFQHFIGTKAKSVASHQLPAGNTSISLTSNYANSTASASGTETDYSPGLGFGGTWFPFYSWSDALSIPASGHITLGQEVQTHAEGVPGQDVSGTNGSTHSEASGDIVCIYRKDHSHINDPTVSP